MGFKNRNFRAMDMMLLIPSFLLGLALCYLLLQARLRSLREKSQHLDLRHGLLQAQYEEKLSEIAQLKEQLRAEAEKVLRLNTELTKTETDFYHAKQRTEEQKGELEQLRDTFIRQFTSVSNQILLENAEHFQKASSANLQKILDPLKERIKDFEAKVEQTYEKTLKESVSLKEQISQLAALNQQMSQDALNLTRALKGESKTQGNWGEYLLERLLEKSGLRKGLHYHREEVLQNEERQTYRPDVVVQLPDNKHLVIDSKLSLVAYEAYCSCTNDGLLEGFLRSHIGSIRTHVSDLSRKNYHRLSGLNSPDFVLMFIPIEPAFTLAVQHDNELFTDAFDRNVVLVSTSTLLATLRTVAGVWRQEDQKRNVLRIAEESGKLYDKFVGFVEDLKAVGKHLENSQVSYSSAVNKLSEGRGNLIRRVELLKELGAKTSKTLDEGLLQEAKALNEAEDELL
jgi:DNA recombination protein RmuC